MLYTLLKDSLRTIFRIRRQRTLPPAGPKPAFGSTIVRSRLKMQIIIPIDHEQWNWLTMQGWRSLDMRTNRRRYYRVPRNAVSRLLKANQQEREQLHQRIVDYKYERRRLE